MMGKYSLGDLTGFFYNIFPARFDPFLIDTAAGQLRLPMFVASTTASAAPPFQLRGLVLKKLTAQDGSF